MKHVINALPFIVVVLVVAVSIWIGSKRKPPAGMICRNCETYAYPIYGPMKGSAVITVILLFFFVLPGIIYAIWRRTGRRPVCAQCGDSSLVPWSSAVGQRIFALKQAQQAVPPIMSGYRQN